MVQMPKQTKRGKWGSKLGFILAASGSAVGLGNIWRFPYTAGENGGAVFVMIYLAAIIIIGLPVLMAEVSLGRFSGQNPVGAFGSIKPRGPWKLVGYLGVVTGIMILSYYSVIAGWTIGYFFKTVTGQFTGLGRHMLELQAADGLLGLATGVSGQIPIDVSGMMFGAFTGDWMLQIGLLMLFLFLTIYIVSKGVAGGIEKLSKILMPALFILLIVLVVRALTLDGAMKGLEFYLSPDFSKLNFKVIYFALGQAFFSLSLGMGAMITYGSYLSKEESLPSATAWVAFFDTFIAIIAGFIIFPAIFSQGMDPAGGPGLVFNILPVIFSKMPGGLIFGALFFALLCIAALTSTISLLEVPVSYFIDQKKWGRKSAAYLLGGVTFIFAIPSALATSGFPFFSKVPLFDMDFLSLWDLIWGNLSLSLGAFLMAVFVAYAWKTANALKELQIGAETFRWGSFWVFSIKFLSPVLILMILVGIFLYGA